MLVKIWMNQKHLEKQVGIANISVKAQYYSSELKKNWDAKNKSVEFINPIEFLLKTL